MDVCPQPSVRKISTVFPVVKPALTFVLLLLLLSSLSVLSAQGGRPPARVNEKWLRDQQPAVRDSIAREEGFRDEEEWDKRFQGVGLHLMPASIFTYYPRLRAGAQYKGARFSFVLDVEFGNEGLIDLLEINNREDYRFFGLRPEVRYELPKLFRGLYVGLEAPYTRTQRQFSGRYRSETLGPVRVDAARQERRRFSAIPKVGAQVLLGKWFTVDAYVGAGIAFVNFDYLDRVNLRSIPNGYFGNDSFFYNENRDDGSYNTLELAAGIRFGGWLGR